MVSYLQSGMFFWTFHLVEKPESTDPHDLVSVTAIEAISATGEAIPSFLIISGVNIPVEFVTKDLDDDIVIATSSTGYITDIIAIEFNQALREAYKTKSSGPKAYPQPYFRKINNPLSLEEMWPFTLTSRSRSRQDPGPSILLIRTSTRKRFPRRCIGLLLDFAVLEDPAITAAKAHKLSYNVSHNENIIMWPKEYDEVIVTAAIELVVSELEKRAA
ncbi:hypothetical protein E4U59_002762 [Claviceps monticola]|nr:hypothetical protein E4U59_002762 [Claviceps monticola]